MISNILHKVYPNTHRLLTVEAVKEHFPQCMACAAGSMKQRPRHRSSEPRNIEAGAEIQIDVQTWASADNIQSVAYNGANHVLTCVDLRTDYTWTYSLRDVKLLTRYLEFLRFVIFHKQRRLCIISDNALFTKEVRDWSMREEVDIQLLPCIPHEHYQIGRVERKHQTYHNAVIKAPNQPHLNSKYWYMALRAVVYKSNLQAKLQLSGASSYRLWHGADPDMLNYPILPFGTVVMAHIPLHLQNKFSGAAVLTYYIGCAVDHYGGFMLWNPATKKSCIRRTFKILGATIENYVPPTIVLTPPTDEEIQAISSTTLPLEPMDSNIDPISTPHRTRSTTIGETGVHLGEKGVQPVTDI